MLLFIIRFVCLNFLLNPLFEYKLEYLFVYLGPLPGDLQTKKLSAL